MARPAPSTDHQAATPDGPAPLLRLRELTVDLAGARILDRVSFDVPAGTCVGLVGESGSGKTMTALAIIGLLPDGARLGGRMELDADDLVGMAAGRRRQLRGHTVAMVFQDPASSLNPVVTVGDQVSEILRRRDGKSRREARAAAVELLRQAGVPEPEARARSYPHQLSGGLRQRAMIALALAGSPRLILADEPTTALDVTVQGRILRLLRDLQRSHGMAMVLVSHDLRVMAHTADQVVVMYAGRVAESGPARGVLRQPAHPYTAELLRSVPAVRTRTPLGEPIAGAPAEPASRPAGCAFHPRCPRARPRCETEQPLPREVAPGRVAACHFAEELLP